MECMVQDGSTPLLLAVRGSHDTIVKALVAAGADASGPLYDACQRGDTPIVHALLASPDVNPNVAQAVRGAGCGEVLVLDEDFGGGVRVCVNAVATL